MYRDFAIKRFRGFQSLKVDSLERVNLIAGRNSVGKTALLEALFIHSGPGNPQLPLQVGILRGMEFRVLDADKLWGWLFYKKTGTIELSSTDHGGISRRLLIRLAVQRQARVRVPTEDVQLGSELRLFMTPEVDRPEPAVTGTGSKALTLLYEDSTGRKSSSRATIETDAISIRANLTTGPLGMFLTARSRVGTDDVERFSNLERTRGQNEVVSILRYLEPRLKRLTVLVEAAQPAIYGDVGIRELVPLALLGEGLSRLLSIVVAILNTPGGIVLVDEIENGLHYSVLVEVWKAIGAAARRSNTQVVATTHSWECIRAAHVAFSETHYDFRLHRLERTNSMIHAVTYDKESLEAALETELEVR